jgi:proline dehydrogenase
MMRQLLLWASENAWLRERMPRLGFVRRAVSRFMPGEDVAAALTATAGLGPSGIGTVLTLLGENVKDEADTAAVVRHYLEVMEAIQARKLDAEVSVKLTHLGLDLDEGLCVVNLTRIVERARAVGALVWVDMESSRYTERTLELYARLRPAHSNLGCVVQAYLRRTPADVERLVSLGATVRLCKGAYHEPATLAFPDKRDVDASYARLVERLLAPDAQARGVYPGFATHDERLQRHVLRTAAARRISADRFELQMLYGIRHDLHASLHAAGVALRVLVPFGEDWYGYFMRRLAERPANLLFLLRNVART